MSFERTPIPEWVYELRRQAAYAEGRIEGTNGRRLIIQPDERLPLIRALLTDEERDALRESLDFWEAEQSDNLESRAPHDRYSQFWLKYDGRALHAEERAESLRALLGEE